MGSESAVVDVRIPGRLSERLLACLTAATDLTRRSHSVRMVGCPEAEGDYSRRSASQPIFQPGLSSTRPFSLAWPSGDYPQTEAPGERIKIPVVAQ